MTRRVIAGTCIVSALLAAGVVGRAAEGSREARGHESAEEGGEHGEKESRSWSAGRGEHGQYEQGREGRGEHAREGKERGGKKGERGEESGTEYRLNQTYNQVRNGARLILAYDAKSKSFKGTVQNVTNKKLEQVRVEVHLSNGKELGPTKPRDLKPGAKMRVRLTPKSTGFNRWSAHPEVGRDEHGSGGHRSEGRGEGRGEHGEGRSG